MKKILFLLLAVAVSFASCDPEKDVPDVKGKLDPNAMITIRPAKGVQLRSTVTGLTALEVVQNAVNIKWTSHYAGNAYFETPKHIARTFMDSQRDFNTPSLKMLGIDVITSEGEYYKDLTYATDVVITDVNNDTIAYIPDKVINNARPLIEAAFNSENYTECYRLFDTAFVFLPYPNQ